MVGGEKGGGKKGKVGRERRKWCLSERSYEVEVEEVEMWKSNP